MLVFAHMHTSCPPMLIVPPSGRRVNWQRAATQLLYSYFLVLLLTNFDLFWHMNGLSSWSFLIKPQIFCTFLLEPPYHLVQNMSWIERKSTKNHECTARLWKAETTVLKSCILSWHMHFEFERVHLNHQNLVERSEADVFVQYTNLVHTSHKSSHEYWEHNKSIFRSHSLIGNASQRQPLRMNSTAFRICGVNPRSTSAAENKKRYLSLSA